ncbi:hypothetical protein MTP99_008967 [Tenebrio molitor]|jgi:hypothetical protein|nr:hypothetical protein MTP99_008967 [Tenebrio molitor]
MQTDIHTYTCNPTDECSRQGATACARLQPDRAKVVWGPHLAPTQCDPLRVVGAAAAGVVHRYRVRAAGLVQWRNTGISTPRKTPTPPCLPKPNYRKLNMADDVTVGGISRAPVLDDTAAQHSETHYDIFIRLSQHFGLVLNH